MNESETVFCSIVATCRGAHPVRETWREKMLYASAVACACARAGLAESAKMYASTAVFCYQQAAR
jgi:hypothetical protein